MEKGYPEILNQKDVAVKQSFIECVAELFSVVMEEEITPLQAACILSLVASLILLVFPVSMPIVIRIAALVWFAVSAWHCKEAKIIDCTQD